MTLVVLGCLLTSVAAWSVGLVRFARSIPDDVADANTATDAIVVLTGGSERLEAGLRLLAENKGERVFISGVHPGVPVGDLMRVAGASPSPIDGRIETGHGARDTAGNAEETASWLRERGYHSLRLVTGSYHMPRSLLEFAHALPNAQVIPNPVFPSRVHQDAWWRNPGTAVLIMTEYNKYLLALARQRLGLPSPSAWWSTTWLAAIVSATPLGTAGPPQAERPVVSDCATMRTETDKTVADRRDRRSGSSQPGGQEPGPEATQVRVYRDSILWPG
jgi:Uncharacterized conserved protein